MKARKAPRKAPPKASVDPPEMRAIYKLIRAYGRAAKLKIDRPRAHRALPLGGKRFVTVFTTLESSGSKEEPVPSSQLFMLLLRRGEGGWEREHSMRLAENSGTSVNKCEGRVAVSLFTDDYDHDGKPEILVRHRVCGMFRAIGFADETHMEIYNAEGAPKRALRASVYLSYGGALFKAKAKFKQLDGDGHPDVEIVSWEIVPAEDDEGRDRRKLMSRTRYLWDPRSDRYIEQIKKKKRKKR